MRRERSGRRVTRITGAALLALTPLLLASGSRNHLGHAAGQTETRIFADARHAGQAEHWEAAEKVWLSRCAACLLPGPLLAAAPAGCARRLPDLAGPALATPLAGTPSPHAGHSLRSRAPPASLLS